MAQWCFPSRRQHAGKLESGPDATSKPTIGEIISAKSKTPRLRRKITSYAH